MLYYLQLEWLKFKNHSITFVLGLFYILFLPGVFFIAKAVTNNLKDIPQAMGSTDVLYIFPTVWQYMGYAGNWITFFFMGFLGVIICTSEFNNRTLRQNIINGLTRKEFFLAKFSFILATCVLATLYYVLVTCLIGYFNTETIYMSKVLQHADYIYRYFLVCFGYMTFGFFVGLFIRKTGVALFLYLVYVVLLENALRYLVHFRLIKNKSMHFYPMNAIEDLTPIPFGGQIETMASDYDFSIFLSPTEAIITTIVFSTLFLVACSRMLLKADL